MPLQTYRFILARGQATWGHAARRRTRGAKAVRLPRAQARPRRLAVAGRVVGLARDGADELRTEVVVLVFDCRKRQNRQNGP